MTTLLLDPVADAPELDLRDWDEIDADDERERLAYRENVLGLPARPGTVRR